MYSTRHWCFDIDGVLVDSKSIVKAVYEEVGVRMPDGAWGLPWDAWLPGVVGDLDEAVRLHEAKTEAYVTMIERHGLDGYALPAAEVARLLTASSLHKVMYVTGASQPAALAVLEALGLDPSGLLAAGVSGDDRAPLLTSIAPHGVYVDDRVENAIAAETAGWDFLLVGQEWPWMQ